MSQDRASRTPTFFRRSGDFQLSRISDGKKKHGPRRRVNFGGLDVEELGSVYEALLDYHPQVTIEGERSRFELVEGSERKSTGSYYTPPELVRELIKSALEPVIVDRLAKANTSDDKERALLALKVCDPASGSGALPARGGAADRAGARESPLGRGRAEPGGLPARGARRDPPLHLCRRQEPARGRSLQGGAVDRGARKRAAASFLRQPREERRQPGRHPRPSRSRSRRARWCLQGGDRRRQEGRERGQEANKAEAKATSLFRHSIRAEIDRIAGAFAAVGDLPETTPDEVHAKEARYVALRKGAEWKRAKWACDLWTAAFFAPLTAEGKPAVPTTRNVWDAIAGRLPQGRVAALSCGCSLTSSASSTGRWSFPEVFPKR